MTLHPVYGHEEARRMVARSHHEGRLPSSLLLHGPKGVGKQRFALWIAQLSVCESPDEESGPCHRCRSCRLLLGLEHPDVHWYMPLARPKGASGDKLVDALEDARHEALQHVREHPLRPTHVQDVTGLYIGTVRNLRKRAHVRPSMASGPVFIVGNAELLVPQEASQEAANALLKLLEEPPGNARFILTTSVPGSLLPTIRSRTVPLLLAPLPDEAVADALREHLDVTEERARDVARLGQGSIGRALGFLLEEDGEAPMNALRRDAFNFLLAALERRRHGAYSLALGYGPAGARGLLDLLDVLEEWIRDLAVVAADGGHGFHHDTEHALRKMAQRSGVEAARVPRALEAVERARHLARGNVNPQLVVPGLVLDLQATLLPPPPSTPSRRP